ncbi:MAG: hypothetical protein KC466_17650, partial [Myxococcales bacterium]|nr:hypothetical protein [Myxococcales bacterium]
LVTTGCATTHPRTAPALPDALAAVHAIVPLRSRVTSKTLYYDTEIAVPDSSVEARVNDTLGLAIARELRERGFEVRDELDAPDLADALARAAMVPITDDLEYRRPETDLRLSDDPAGGREGLLDGIDGDAVALLIGETVSETPRDRRSRLLWNYGLGLVQLPTQLVLTIFAPAFPVSIPTIPLYEPSPSRTWLQWILVRRADGVVLYLNDLFSTDAIVVEGEPEEIAADLLEALPARGAEPR